MEEGKIIDTRYTQNRELSWLRFNERVLEEARDESVPLLERLKFAAIFTSNLDEFYMVRVGSLHDMTLLKDVPLDNKTGETPQEELQAIFKASKALYKQREKVMNELETRCRSCNICRLGMDELDSKAKKKVSSWFKKEVRPILSPQVVDIHHPFPHLVNKNLYIVVNLQQEDKQLLGILPVPSALPPFFQLKERGIHFVMTEDVMLKYVGQVFDQFTVTDKIVISVTRNADIDPEDETYDVDADFRQHMKKILKKRARLAPVRLEVKGTGGEALVASLCERLELSPEQVFRVKHPIHLNYLFSLRGLLPEERAAALSDLPYTPRFPLDLSENERIIPQVLRHDTLLFYPYESMDPFLKLLSEASCDSSVLSIKITIYRLAARAKLVDYLCTAAENGKQVTVVMELRARFDEQNNIRWAEQLEKAGCTVLYGFEGIKVHSKVCLITRREHGRIRYITQIGTGNYNEKTAKQYTDLSLITANPEIGEDAAQLFQNLATVNLRGKYKRLWVSPYGIRDHIIECMEKEMKKGSDGFIFLKFNSLSDRVLIDKLVEASQAGVEIIMNVRGICCLLPGIPGLTENIRVFSVVGRYLEHIRLYCFGRGDDAKLYLSSADFMTRNMERRVEVACPILDTRTRARVFRIIQEYQKDNVKARVMGPDGSYHRIKNKNEHWNCQEEFQRSAAPVSIPSKRNAEKAGAGISGRLRNLFRRSK